MSLEVQIRGISDPKEGFYLPQNTQKSLKYFIQALEKGFERKKLELDAQQQLEEDEQYQAELSADLGNIVADTEENSLREKQNEVVSHNF